MSPCNGDPNFVARSTQSGLSGAYEVSGSGYAGVIATIVGSAVAPHAATLLGASSCSSPTPTPTRTPTPSTNYNYYTVLETFGPSCNTFGTPQTIRTTLTLSTGVLVADGGICYEVTGTATGPTYNFNITSTTTCAACNP